MSSCRECLAVWPQLVIESGEEGPPYLTNSNLAEHPCATNSTGKAGAVSIHGGGENSKDCCQNVVHVNPDKPDECTFASTGSFYDASEYPCTICYYGQRDMTDFDNTPFLPPPIASDHIDCGTCTNYYPEASPWSPRDEYGTLSDLTRHACAYYDKDTSDCCRYDEETGMCAVYMDHMFLYPCGPSCYESGSGTINLAVVIPLVVLALMGLLALFVFLRNRVGGCKTNSSENDIPLKKAHQLEPTPVPISTNTDGRAGPDAAVPLVIGELVENRPEENVATVKAYPEPNI